MRLHGRALALALAVCVVVATAGCSSSEGDDAGPSGSGSAKASSADPRTGTFPGKAWATAEPESMGFDPDALEEIAADAEAAASDCFMVVRHGKVVGSWRWNGTDSHNAIEAFSVSKSFTAVLAGIARDEGKLDFSEKASTYIPQWKGTESEGITVKNLLSNDSGRHWDFRTDYFKMTGAADRSKFAASLPQDSEPGKIWVYNNSAIQLLSEVLQQATGVEPNDYAEEKLFGPIGMADSSWSTDSAGNTATFMGVQSTCEDLARFGLLMLRGGNWDGKQVVSEEFVAEATSPSQELNESYGYLFWLNRKGRLPLELNVATTPGQQTQKTRIGQKRPGAPEDMFWALGLGNQIIQMDPGSDTVVVRMGPGRKPEGAGRFTDEDTVRVVTEALQDEGAEGEGSS